MTKIRQLALSTRILNRLVRLSTDAKSMCNFGFFEGLTCAYHVKQEIQSLRKAQWEKLKYHYISRFNQNTVYKCFFEKTSDLFNVIEDENNYSSSVSILKPFLHKFSYNECWSLYEYFRYFIT